MASKPPKSAEPGTTWNDPKTPGLSLRFMKTKAVYYLYYRTKGGRERRMKLGDERLYTLTDARERARDILNRVDKGEDPAGQREELTGRPTMADLKRDHLDHAETRNKASWRGDIEALYDNHVLPHFGAKTAVADITEAEVAALHHKMRKTPAQANRMAAMLHKAFNLAEKWGWRDRNANPVTVERYKENKRKRFPHADEAVRLLIALDAMRPEKPHFVGLVELLCLTGARLTEIQYARREWIRPDGLHLPDSKTGEKIIPLSKLAREVIDEIPAVEGNPYLIVGRRRGRPLVNVSKPWKELMEKARITDTLWRHDLRRFFASAGLSGGLELSTIGGLLGHMDTQTTKRYAFLLTDAAQEAADRTSERVREIMTGAGKVIPLEVAN